MSTQTRYAATTKTPVDKTRTEIEAALRRYDADAFGYAWTTTTASIMFEIGGRRVRILLPLPDRKERRFTHHSRGERNTEAAEAVYEQACRQSWRALLLIVKAKLETVAAGISTIEREFLADVVLPDGSTVGDWVRPQLERVYARGDMPVLLPGTSVNGASR